MGRIEKNKDQQCSPTTGATLQAVLALSIPKYHCIHDFAILCSYSYIFAPDRISMRLSTSACATALLLALPSAADNALVYVTGITPPDNPPMSLSPSEARLVIAQRLGLTRYHNLKEADDHSLRAINTYGSKSQSILSSQHYEPPRRALAIIEGVVEPEGADSCTKNMLICAID